MTGTDQPIVNIRGERVALGPFSREILDDIYRWFNNFATDRTQGDLPAPRTSERLEAWYNRVTTEATMQWFVIYEIATWTPIGITWFAAIDYRNGTAEFGISVGEPDTRGKGYGTETTRLMIDHAFKKLGLHNVKLEVYAINRAGIRAYTKAGFREIGRQRENYVMGGKRYDTVHMEVVRRDAGYGTGDAVVT
jgi:RimJ/RimL family protein N-acetyltransferase